MITYRSTIFRLILVRSDGFRGVRRWSITVTAVVNLVYFGTPQNAHTPHHRIKGGARFLRTCITTCRNYS
jgi:hypothetical protein